MTIPLVSLPQSCRIPGPQDTRKTSDIGVEKFTSTEYQQNKGGGFLERRMALPIGTDIPQQHDLLRTTNPVPKDEQ